MANMASTYYTIMSRLFYFEVQCGVKTLGECLDEWVDAVRVVGVVVVVASVWAYICISITTLCPDLK